MKLYRQKFEYWDDDHTKLIRKTKEPEFVDPEYYTEAHIREDEKWPHRYFLNKRCWDLMKRHGPFSGHYKDCDNLASTERSAFIVCPGPSMRDVDFEALGSHFTIAVNSAGFAFESTYWCIAESGYARWLMDSRYPLDRTILATARVAVVLRAEEKRCKQQKFRVVYVLRWEEERVVPPRTPAVSITNALVTAWQMGCPKAYIIGLDLSKPGKPYADGLPYTREGAKNLFDDQIRALKQFKLPDFQVINCSSHSANTLTNFDYMPIECLNKNLRSIN